MEGILEIHIWYFFIIQVSVLLAFMIPIYSLVSVEGNSFFSSQNGMGSENAKSTGQTCVSAM